MFSKRQLFEKLNLKLDMNHMILILYHKIKTTIKKCSENIKRNISCHALKN